MTDVLAKTAADKLRSFVNRIERIQEEIDELNEGKRDVYAEAKAMGFDKTALRIVIRRRARDKMELEEQDQIVDLYEGAIQDGLHWDDSNEVDDDPFA